MIFSNSNSIRSAFSLFTYTVRHETSPNKVNKFLRIPVITFWAAIHSRSAIIAHYILCAITIMCFFIPNLFVLTIIVFNYYVVSVIADRQLFVENKTWRAILWYWTVIRTGVEFAAIFFVRNQHRKAWITRISWALHCNKNQQLTKTLVNTFNMFWSYFWQMLIICLQLVDVLY